MTRSVPGGTVWLCRCDPGQVGAHTSCFAAAAEAECTVQDLQLWRLSGTWSRLELLQLPALVPRLLNAGSVTALQPGGVSGTAQGADSVALMQQALPWVEQW